MSEKDRTDSGSAIPAPPKATSDSDVDPGYDALRPLPRGDFELVVTDVNMPNVQGSPNPLRGGKPTKDSDAKESDPVVVINTDNKK
jgi:hypothetical protein